MTKLELRQLIANGKSDHVINYLIQEFPDDNTVILLNSRYSNLEEAKTRGNLNYDDYLMNLNKINNDALGFLKKIEDKNFVKTPSTYSVDLNKPIKIELIRKQEKFESSKDISNVAISPDGNFMSFSQERKLFIVELTDAFPEIIGQHLSGESEKLNKGHLEYILNKNEFLGLDNSEAHGFRITDLSFSPDGNEIVSVDNDGGVKLWDFKTKRCLNGFQAHNDAITSIQFSPKGDLLATAGFDEFLKIWNYQSIKEQKVGFSPLRVFEKKSNIKRIHRRKGPYEHDREQIISIAFSPNGKHIATGDQQGVIVIREIISGEEVYRNKVHNHYIQCLCFSPSHPGLLASGSDDTRIRLIDFVKKSGRPYTLGVGKAKHSAGVNSVAFSFKGDMIVSSAGDRKIKIWDIESQSLIKEIKNDNGFNVDRIVFFPNRYDFATDSFFSDISIWQISNVGSISNTKIDFSN